MSAISKAAGRVLVVEDEALVRLSAREEIEAAGFKVYEAYNADEAIRLLEANPDIELIFTDVDMPGSMDGVKLAHYVRTRWPPVKIIVTSGYQHWTAEQLPKGSVGPTCIIPETRRFSSSAPRGSRPRQKCSAARLTGGPPDLGEAKKVRMG
jgi:CheY-like chemotaxis protein